MGYAPHRTTRTLRPSERGAAGPIRDPITILISLGITGVMALAVVFFMLRVQKAPRGPSLVRGYPPERFPAQDLTRTGPLAALAAISSTASAIVTSSGLRSLGSVALILPCFT